MVSGPGFAIATGSVMVLNLSSFTSTCGVPEVGGLVGATGRLTVFAPVGVPSVLLTTGVKVRGLEVFLKSVNLDCPGASEIR